MSTKNTFPNSEKSTTNARQMIKQVSENLLDKSNSNPTLQSLVNLLGHPIDELGLEKIDRAEFSQFATDYYDR